MEPLTHKETLAYFKNINLQLIDFSENSFFRMDLEEVFGAFRRKITFPAIGIESPDIETSESSVNSSVLDRRVAFTILVNPRNFDEQNQMLDHAERIGLKIWARMRLDSTKKDNILYRRFKLENWNAKKVGPLYSEKLYGYRFTGILSGHEPLKVKPEDWDDIDSVC